MYIHIYVSIFAVGRLNVCTCSYAVVDKLTFISEWLVRVFGSTVVLQMT